MPIEGYEWRPISQVVAECPSVDATNLLWEKYPGYQGLWCRWYWAMINTMRIERCLVVAHGPLGCVANERTFWLSDQHWPMAFIHTVSTKMGNQEVILGGEEKLEETLRQVARDYKPPLIIVHTNCVAGLNMDDVPAVIERVKDEIDAKIVYIPCEGFSATLPGETMRKNLPYFVDIMDPPKQVREKTVNILGVTKEGRLGCEWDGPGVVAHKEFPHGSSTGELTRYLEALGLKLNRLIMAGDYEYVRTAPEAAVNAIYCPAWGYPIAWEMERRFGTPYLPDCEPIGIEATGRWINGVAQFFNVKEQAARFINEESEKIKDVWEKTKGMVKGKVAIIEAGRNALNTTARPLANSRFAMELGMTPYIINMAVPIARAKDYVIEHYTKQGVDPLFLSGPYPYAAAVNIVDVVKDLGLAPDEVVYMSHDVFTYQRAGTFDACNVSWGVSGSITRQWKNRPRQIGFRGTEAQCLNIIGAVEAAKRKKAPTFFGRVYGRTLEWTKGG